MPDSATLVDRSRLATLQWVGAELTRRFGLPRWSFSLTATDANRWAIRLARAVTGRQKILFHSYCYHGSVDEPLIVVGTSGEGGSREGNVGAPRVFDDAVSALVG